MIGSTSDSYCVVDYDTATVDGIARLLLDGWQSAPGTHESMTTVDDLSYIVLVKGQLV